ncbi:hypothetical protein Fmac_001723 [Flemingia macrophylla]|uniref:Chlororespiratory reduction 3 n=1 Tax=Flemingia macrophylla TaxID=520843 RepID=A0ABD1NIP7_9FABA
MAAFCLSRFCLVTKAIVANARVPENSDSEQRKNGGGRRRIRKGAPKLSVMQMERMVGAGSFRDAEPPPLNVDMRKTVMDLFLGQAIEGDLQKKIRHTGEWLATNVEPKIRSNRKGILMFIIQWMLPVWAIFLLVAYGAIKLPFSNPFLDDLIM